MKPHPIEELHHPCDLIIILQETPSPPIMTVRWNVPESSKAQRDGIVIMGS